MNNDQVIIICRNRIPAIDSKKMSKKHFFLILIRFIHKFLIKNISAIKNVKIIKLRIINNIIMPEWIGSWRFGIFELLNFVLNNNKYVYDPQENKKFFNPTGIPTITSLHIYDFLLKKGYSPVNFDNVAEYKDELKMILKNNPLAVALSATYFMQSKEMKEIVLRIRGLNKNVPIAIGSSVLLTKLSVQGKLPQDYEDILIDENIYFILEENGLPSLHQLLDALKNNKDIKFISNLVYKRNGSINYTQRDADVLDLNNDFPDWPKIAGITQNIAFVRASQGCSFRCKFCTFPKATVKIYQRSVESVRNELREIKKSGIKYFAFTDDHFAVHPKRIEQICQMMIDEKFNFKWFAGIRSSSITEENAVLLKKSGCKVLCVGLESGDDRMLKLMDKKTTVADNQRCLEILDKNKITAYGSFMLGFPGETEESINNTINWINNSSLQLYKIYLFYMLPGSIIFDEQHEHNVSYFGDKYDYCLWKTPTMDALRASEKLREFISRIDHAGLIYNYSPMYAFFPFYLKGYDNGDIIKFFKIKTELVKNELSDCSWLKRRKIRKEKFDQLKTVLTDHLSEY